MASRGRHGGTCAALSLLIALTAAPAGHAENRLVQRFDHRNGLPGGTRALRRHRVAAVGPGVDLWLCARLDLRCSYQETADELGITIHTVRHYIRGVYRKLQVHSVADAVRRAVRERLV